MLETIHATAKKIKRLEVQGARNIAIATIKAIETLAKETKAKNKKEILFASRETKPLMRNAVRWIISQVEKSSKVRVKELAEIVSCTHVPTV